MKVGDLVKRKPWKTIEHNPTKTDGAAGIVIESGVYVGRKDVKIYWPSLNEIRTEFQKSLEVISESR